MCELILKFVCIVRINDKLFLRNLKDRENIFFSISTSIGRKMCLSEFFEISREKYIIIF